MPDHLDLRCRPCSISSARSARSICGFCVPDQTRDAAVAIVGAPRRTGRSSRASGTARHRCAASACRRARNRGVDVALFVDQRARRGGIGAQRGLDVGSRSGSGGHGFQLTFELRRARLIAFSSRSATTPTKSPMRHHRDHAGNVARPRLHRRAIRLCADEGAGIDAGIGRAHHAAVQHAGHAHVVHKDQIRRSPWPECRRAARSGRRCGSAPAA